MENRTRFNLIEAVGNWKKSFSNSHSMTPDNIEELESHLLDEIDNLKLKGLNEEESFLIATKRMGTKESLVSEFSKLNIFNTIILKCMPFIKGVLLYICLSKIIGILGTISMFISLRFDYNPTIINTILLLSFGIVSLLGSYWMYNKIRNGKRVLSMFISIPFLVFMGVISHIVDALMRYQIMRQISINDYGIQMGEVSKFYFYITVFILLSSLIIYFKSRIIRKKQIA